MFASGLDRRTLPEQGAVLPRRDGGTSHDAGTAETIGLYEAVGIGQWFRYVAGSIEVMTAVLLLIPLPTFFAGIGLALTVVEAGLTHLALIGNGVW